MIKVELLEYTPNPDKVVATAAKLCYSSKSVSELVESVNEDEDKTATFVERLMSYGHHCYDDKTEVLTNHGFKLWPEVTEDDLLATVNPETKEFYKFEKPLKLIKEYVENEELIVFDSRYVNLKITSNHNLYCSLSNSEKNRLNPKFSLIKANELVGKKKDKPVYSVPMRMAKNASNPYHTIDNNDIVYALYGFFIGDGYARKCKKECSDISFHLKLKRKIEFLKDICNKLEYNLVEYSNNKYFIKEKNIGFEYRKMFYNENGEKTFPDSFYNMSAEQFQYFMLGLKNSDGSKGKTYFNYDTTSLELANKIQALATINGITCFLTKDYHDFSKNNNINNKNGHRLFLSKSESRNYPHLNDSRTEQSYYSKETYSGYVYCATVSTGLLVVRRNYKTVLSGNSPFEHLSFTFGIEGVSRTLTHQLVRHRIASYSQKSQRYVNEKEFEYITPPSIQANDEALGCYEAVMKMLNNAYGKLVDLGIPKEDARYVLPNACETKIIVTMNARSLFNFFNHRCCMRAQWEIRQMAYQMLKLVKEVAPETFKKAGASCDTLGYCVEGNMSCGRYSTLNDILTNFKSKGENKNV